MLEAADLRRLLDTTYTLHQQVEFHDFPGHVIAATADLIASDVCSYGEVDTVKLNAATMSNHTESVAPPLVDSWARHTLDPNLLVYWKMFSPYQVTKFSDYLSDREIESLPIYEHYFKQFGVYHQIILPFICDSGVILSMGYSRRRGARDFEERDREILKLIGPHVTQAYRTAEMLELAKRNTMFSDCDLSCTRTGLIVLSPHGSIQAATADARRWVDEYFGNFPSYSSRLPSQLWRWVRPQLHDRADLHRGVSRPRRPLQLRRADCMLTVSLAGNLENDELALVFEHREQIPNEAVAERLDITPRKAEVVRWLMQGKTNAEIGKILGISSRTVQKHIEHIYEKLDVSNRATAIAKTLEMLSDDEAS